MAGSERSPAVASSRARLRGALSRVGCSPAEALALALLTAGAVAALAVLWLLARPGTAVVEAPAVMDAPTVGLTPLGPSGPSELLVHVAGQVTTPGVYRLPPGSRVADALGLAGGPLPDAALDSVNLARPLVDGEQVVVPGPGQPPPGPGAPSGGSAPPAPGGSRRPDGTLDLNLATAEEFEELPGVGPVLAQRILDHRAAIGRFTSVGELRDIAGIGEKTFQALSAEVSV